MVKFYVKNNFKATAAFHSTCICKTYSLYCSYKLAIVLCCQEDNEMDMFAQRFKPYGLPRIKTSIHFKSLKLLQRT